MSEHALAGALWRAERGLHDLEAALSGRSRGYLIERYFAGDPSAAYAFVRARLEGGNNASAAGRRDVLNFLSWDEAGPAPTSSINDYYPRLISPFLQLARHRFCSITPPFSTEQEFLLWRRPLERDVARRLNQLLTSAIVLEQQDTEVKGSFDLFVQFFERYPMLLRFALAIVVNTTSDLSALRHRLSSEIEELRAAFGVSSLLAIGDALGDPHAGGATVRTLQFREQTLVYKPRSIAGEVVLNRALTWLGHRAPHLCGRTMMCMARDNYGYEEFIPHAPLGPAVSPAFFYQRAGASLFTSWLLGVTDLHYENIIASGESPVIVDAEAFFWRPFLRGGTLSELALRDGALHSALLLNGLLPSPITMASRNVSLGGLAEAAAIGRPFLVQKLERSERGMRLVEAPVGPEGRMENLPVQNGVQARPRDFTSDLIAGFKEAREVISAASGDFASAVLSETLPKRQRVILRETSFYARLLTALSHPSVASQPREAEALLGQLYVASERRPQDQRVAAAEAEALLDRDIPYFSAFESEFDLFSGASRIGQWFDQSGQEGLMDRLRHAQSLASAHESVVRVCLEGETAQSNGLWDEAPAGDDLFGWTSFIADMLDQRRLAACKGDFWLTLAPQPDRSLSVAPNDVSLYAGAGGIGVFLAALGEQRHADLMARLDKRMRSELAHPSLRSPGALDGVFSVYYCQLLMQTLRGAPPPPVPSCLADFLVGALAEDLRLDWVSGAAGILRVSAELFARTGDANAKRVAAAAAKRLIDTANIRSGAASWSPNTVQQELCGFAHGAAGIAYALTWYGSTCDDHASLAIADAAFGFVHDQWRTEGAFRNAQGANAGVSWCHGALGVYLAAQRTLQLRPLANASLAQTGALSLLRMQAQFASHDLCHGAIGSIEFQLAEGAFASAARTLSQYLDDLRGGAFETPFLLDDGLFAGTTGLGYQCLRATAPHKIPCLLTLDLPSESFA